MQRLAGIRIVGFGPRDQRFQDIRQHLRIWTRSQGALLSAAKSRSGDHLHGARDLARVDHAANAPPDVENVGHKNRRELSAASHEPLCDAACRSSLLTAGCSLHRYVARRSLLTATSLLPPAGPAQTFPCTP